MTNEQFGQWLRRVRRELDLTQEALAERVGCAATTVRTFESGARRPSRSMAERLADVLAIPAAERELFLRLARARPAVAERDPTPMPATFQDATPSASAAGSLPRQLTSFVGRQAEVAALARLLPTTRLLTLIGSGGAGKTRLAFVLAAQQPAEVALVELASLADPALLPASVAAALGVTPQPGSDLLDGLAMRLVDADVLLLLDNCEHLVSACATLVARLLVAYPRLRILATSREPLAVPGEIAWRVVGLALPIGEPASVEHLAASEAVQLFVERAQARLPQFKLTAYNLAPVAQICRRLDGIPLALELAAARVAALGVASVAARLDDALALLTGGGRTAPQRHQTLRDTIAWSYGLLTAEERFLLRQLAVFAGGWTLEAAEAIGSEPATVDQLVRLVDQSLVSADEAPDGRLRYRLLESVRQFAYARLEESGEAGNARRRHASYFQALADRFAPGAYSAHAGDTLRQLASELDNLRAALQYLVEQSDPLPLAQLCRALGRFWHVAGRLDEGRDWLSRALVRQAELPPDLVATLSYLGGELAVRAADYQVADQLYAQAVACAQQASAPDMLRLLAYARRGLGWAAYSRGDAHIASRWYDESRALFEQLGDREGVARILISLGELAMLQGDSARARALHSTCLNLVRELGDQRGEAVELINLGWVELHDRALSASVARFRAGLAIAHELADTEHISECLIGIAAAASAAGYSPDRWPAARLIGAADALSEAVGVRVPAMYHQRFARIRAASEAQLDPQQFAAAYAEGRSLSLHQALAEAATIALDTTDRFLDR